MYRKNVAGQFIGFVAIDKLTGDAISGTTGFAAYRVIDNDIQVVATGTVTDKGNGQYSFALSQADTNGNDVSILFTMTGMVPIEKTIVTTACDPTTASNFGITALPTVAAGTADGLFIAGTNAATSTSSFTATFNGDLTGSVASVTGLDSQLSALSTYSGLTTAELAKFLTVDSTKTWGDVVAGSIAKLIADNVKIYLTGLGI